MTQHMPLPALCGVAVPTPRDGAHEDVLRLLATWKSVAASMTTSEAHQLPDAEELMDQLGLIEQAIQERHPRLWRIIDPQLTTALVQSAHISDTGYADCLVCRRLALGLPVDLPLPAIADLR